MRVFALCGLALTLAGCATVTRGTTDQMTVTSDPSGARVTTSLEQACVTPCTFTVQRKDEFVVTIAADGYKTQEIPVKTQVASAGAAGFAGNVLIGGVIGMGVDAATGSTLEHVPNPINAQLEPVEPDAKPVTNTKTKQKKPSPDARVAPPSADQAPLTQ